MFFLRDILVAACLRLLYCSGDVAASLSLRHCLGLVLFALLGVVSNAMAVERIEPTPKELQDVAVVEHLGSRIPLDTHFTDEQGRSVMLRDLFEHDRPVLLTLNYSDCPMLCNLQLDGLVQSLKTLQSSNGFKLGQEFDVVTISINPQETQFSFFLEILNTTTPFVTKMRIRVWKSWS